MRWSIGESATTADLAFCPTLRALYETGISVGRSGRTYEQKGGLSTLNNLLSMRRLFEAGRPERTLETGFSCGGSALMFAACHQAIGRPPRLQHTAIDPFQEIHSDGMGLMNLARAGLEGYVRTILAPSQTTLPGLLRDNERFGMIYLDGSKEPEDLDCDTYFVTRLLNVGGTMVFDDCTMPSVLNVVRSIEKNQRQYFSRIRRSQYRRAGPIAGMLVRAAERLGKVQMVAFRKIAEL